MLKSPKHSKIEVVAPKEEEAWFVYRMVLKDLNPYYTYKYTNTTLTYICA